MKNFRYLIVLFALVLIPNAASADVKAAAYRISDTRALFIIPFEFRNGSDEFEVPIVAENGLAFNSSVNAVGYATRQDGTLVRTGYDSTGIILSSEDLSLGKLRYEQPSNSQSEYVLVVVLNVPAGTSERLVGLQITNIPYYDDGDRKVVAEGNLATFRTPEVRLGRSVMFTPTVPTYPTTATIPSGPQK